MSIDIDKLEKESRTGWSQSGDIVLALCARLRALERVAEAAKAHCQNQSIGYMALDAALADLDAATPHE